MDPEVHADPFGCSQAWQVTNHQIEGNWLTPLIRMGANSALVFAAGQAQGLQHLFPLDLGFSACPLLGESPVPLLAEYVASRPRNIDAMEITIGGVRQGSRLEQALLSGLDSPATISVRSERVLRAASLEGGLDGYLARRSSRLWKNLRRESRRAKDNGIQFQRVRPQSPSGIRTTFRRMQAIERSSWKADCENAYSILSKADLYRPLLERMSRSRDVRIVFAMVDRRDVGFILGGVFGSIYSGMHFSYDQSVAALSIGNLLQLEKIRWLCQDGIQRYDMGISGGGRIAYKRHWAEIEIPERTFQVSVS